MALPLLGNDFLSSPTMDGVVSSKTADLIASQGAHLAKEIELRSVTDEAKIMAPKVQGHYAQAYQKIAVGDFTGFADMQQARTLATGNPILMSTLDEADKLAGKLAGEFMANQRAEIMAEKSKSLAEFQLTKQAELQKSIDARADKRIQYQQQAHDQSTGKQLYMQEKSNWDRENHAGQKQYEEQVKLYEKRMQAYKAQVQMGDASATPPEKPQPFTPRPAPKLEDFMSGPLPVGGDPDAAPLPSLGGGDDLFPTAAEEPSQVALPQTAPSAQSTSVVSGASSSAKPLVAGDSIPLAGMPLRTEDGVTLPGALPEGTESTVGDTVANDLPVKEAPALPAKPVNMESAMPPAVAKGEPLVNQNALPLGNVKVTIGKVGPEAESVSVNTETGAITKQYKYNDDDKKFISAVSFINETSPRFAQFIADAYRQNKKVELVDAPGDEKGGSKFYYAKAGNVVLTDINRDIVTGEPIRDAEGKVQRVPLKLERTGDKDSPGAADAWYQAASVMGKVPFKIEKTELPEQAKEPARRRALIDAATTNVAIADINQQLKSYGVPEITEDDVKATKAQLDKDAAAPREKQNNDEWDARADQELRKRGLLSPNDEDPQAKRQKESIAAAKRVDELDAEIKTIENQLAGFSKGRLTQGEHNEAKKLQKKLIMLEDERKQKNAIAVKNDTTMVGP